MHLKQITVTHNTKEQAPGVFASWTWTDDSSMTYENWLDKIISLYGEDITVGPLVDNPERESEELNKADIKFKKLTLSALKDINDAQPNLFSAETKALYQELKALLR